MTTSAREFSSRLADLLRREHSAMADFLVALSAFDRDRLWEQLGHPSLFSFLRRELRLSAGAAQYRKTAAELVQRFPQVEAALRDGHLCLSSVIELAKVITPENAAEVLPRFFGLSARDAAFVAVSIRPVENPPVREFVVTPLRLDAAARVTPNDAAARGLVSGTPVAFRTSETTPCSAPRTSDTALVGPPSTRDRPVIKPLDAERARVNMTVPRRLLDKLAAARDALSHSHPGASEEQIIELGLDLIIQRQAKRRGLVEKPRRPTAPPAPESNSETAPRSPLAEPARADLPVPQPPRRNRNREPIPAHVKRAVWLRDGGRCQWPLAGGGVCGSTLRVEIDHIVPVALGGRSTVENCELKCRRHNDLAARRVYGDAHMDQFTAPARSSTEGAPGA